MGKNEIITIVFDFACATDLVFILDSKNTKSLHRYRIGMGNFKKQTTWDIIELSALSI